MKPNFLRGLVGGQLELTEPLTEEEIKAIYRDSFYEVDSKEWREATKHRFDESYQNLQTY